MHREKQVCQRSEDEGVFEGGSTQFSLFSGILNTRKIRSNIIDYNTQLVQYHSSTAVKENI